MKNLKSIFLISLIIFTALIHLAFSLKFPRHVNPEEIPEESLLPEGLFAFYLNVIDLSTLKRYDEALEELRKTHLFYMPENLKFIASRFNDFLADATNKLNLIEYHIERAEEFINIAKLEAAKTEVNEASSLLSETEKTILNLESSASQLAYDLKVKPKPLLDKVVELKALIKTYAKKIDDLSKLIEELTPSPEKSLVKPKLTIQASTLKVWVGERLIINGFLKAFDKGLAKKVIHVYFEGVKIGEALTDENGAYSIEVQIPYIYKPFATIFSVFKPSKEEVYSPCFSNTLTLKLLYYEPKLFISSFPSALPGMNLTIYGNLSLLDKPIEDWKVELYAFNESLFTFTNKSGSFKFEVPIPSTISIGAWPAVINIPPKGKIAPTLKFLTINVEKIQVKINVEASTIAFSGSKITFKCLISLEGIENLTANKHYEAWLQHETIENLMVNAKVGEWKSIMQKINGNPFNIEVYVPLTALTGDYIYEVSIKPSKSWISSASTKGSIFILSPLTLTMPILTVFAAILTVKKPKPKERRAESPKEIVKKVFHKPTEGLAALYWNAVHMIFNWIGVEMKDSYTIREYLHAVSGKLMKGFIFFRQLSLAYEKLLYARWIPLKELEKAKSAYVKLQSLYEKHKEEKE